MLQRMDAMEVALRVLQALTQSRDPDPADVAELRRLAPLLADAPIDEVACDVVQRGVKPKAALTNAAD